MAGLISLGSTAKALWPGLNSIYGMSYNEYPPQFKDIYKTYSSQKNYEEDLGVYGFGLPTVKPEGQDIEYDSSAQGWTYRYVHTTYGLGYIITREAVEDNQYKEIATQRAKALGKSFRQAQEVLGASLINNAFASSPTYGDGVKLISTANLKMAGGTWSNTLSTGYDLSEYAIEQLCINIQNAVDDRNLKMRLTPVKLLIPTALQFEACRILESTGQNDSANNAINALKKDGVFSGGYSVNNYLTDTNAWFILTDAEGLKYFERRPVEFSNDTPDFDSENMKFKGTMRISFGCTDKHAIYGTAGAS